jgi:hypothetical protein
VEIMMDVQVGSTITNGSSCIRVTERVARDARWRAPGWRGISIPLEQFGGNAGMSEFVPDYLLSGWYHVPFEWRTCIGGSTEERYVWAPGWRRLQREVRINFPRKRCAEADSPDHAPGHEWQELHIPTGNPLVEHSQWWRCEARPIEVSAPVGNLGDEIPAEPGAERDAWLAARGWSSYDEWAARGEEA